MGGLTLDEATGQVKDLQGGAIKGLYAAGRTAVGIPSYLYMSGLSIADCVFSGLRAADHASETLHNEISEPTKRQ
jgi:3-oxo-5alpha-steroid 4-dehydrogenase